MSTTSELTQFICPICGLEGDPLILIVCGHTFCKECSQQLESFKCPICRKTYYDWMLIRNKYLEKDPVIETPLTKRISEAINIRKQKQEQEKNSYLERTVNYLLEMFSESLKTDIETRTKFCYTIESPTKFYTRLSEQLVQLLREKLNNPEIKITCDESYYTKYNPRGYSYIIIISYLGTSF